VLEHTDGLDRTLEVRPMSNLPTLDLADWQAARLAQLLDAAAGVTFTEPEYASLARGWPGSRRTLWPTSPRSSAGPGG